MGRNGGANRQSTACARGCALGPSSAPTHIFCPRAVSTGAAARGCAQGEYHARRCSDKVVPVAALLALNKIHLGVCSDDAKTTAAGRAGVGGSPRHVQMGAVRVLLGRPVSPRVALCRPASHWSLKETNGTKKKLNPLKKKDVQEIWCGIGL